MQIRVSGISPPPLGWRGENVRIICTRCQAVFDLRREAGVFVKRLELRGLPAEWQTFCDTCGAAVVGGQLLVAVGAGATVAEVKEAIRGALTLRHGHVLSF